MELVNVMHFRPCGCSAYLTAHDTYCPETPIYAQLANDMGEDPMDAFPYMIFGLIR